MQIVHNNKWKIAQDQVYFLLNHSLPCEVFVLKYWTQVLLYCVLPVKLIWDQFCGTHLMIFEA